MADSFFSTAKIRFNELYQQSINFISDTYQDVGQYFTLASPMGQLLQVVLNLGRMILFYVEDSITELNINTASRETSVKGIASITGHNPSRSMAARGTLRLTYNGEKLSMYGNTIIIPNYTMLTNTQNNLIYTIVLPGQDARLELTSMTNYLDVNVVQGSIEFQQSTGSGDPLQSFNFQSKKGTSIDNYFVNVYVDGKKWEIRDSILDMVFDEESCMVKTGVTGGIDVFFGNGYNGRVPRLGSTILVEYLLTDGDAGNLTNMTSPSFANWKFKTPGYSINTEQIEIDKYVKVSIKNDIIFGTLNEPVYLTRLLAPHMSRSFVLANQNNYIYFLRKLNIFTVIDAIPGFATFEDQYALDKYNQATTTYENINKEYKYLLSTVGANSSQTKAKKVELDTAQKQVFYYQQMISEQKKDDNTVYLFLIPDVNKRIANNQNYYTCSLDSFKLTYSEKVAILDLIEESGQRVITVDNVIMELKYPKFSLNVVLVIYEGYDFETIRQAIITATSEYFLKNTRRDRIPLSDIIRIIENISGVDSVNAWFDADVNNLNIYNTGYGLDEYGDILLERYVKDAFGNNIPVKDVYPLIRGGWESFQGISYEDSTDRDKLSSINITVRGYTKVDYNSKANKTIVGSL
jgi:hypothetical protein